MNVTELNAMTKYRKIYTLFERSKDFKVIEGTFNEELKGIRNIKNFVLTMKIDGTNCGIVLVPSEKGFPDVQVLVRKRSKIVQDDQEHKIYFDAVKSLDLTKAIDFFNGSKNVVVLYGEVCGKGIQEEGHTYSDKPVFKLFDIKCGNNFFNWRDLLEFSKVTGVPTVKWLHPTALHNGDVFDYNMWKKYLEQLNTKKYCEGFVVRSEPLMFNNFGERMIFKIKWKDFKK